jgi:tRNA modification GTPase
MNALARRDVAIVSEQAGTTRDVIEVRLDLGGFPVILMDTAGIREATGEIEREGVRRTLERAKAADLVLWIEDATSGSSEGAAGMNAPIGVAIIEAWNKIDLAHSRLEKGKLAFSVKTGEGMDRLIVALTDAAREAADVGENPVITRTRHRTGLESCRTALDHFLAGDFVDLELRAEDLRQAATSLGRLTGRVDVEDILDRIFADFCIGK